MLDTHYTLQQQRRLSTPSSDIKISCEWNNYLTPMFSNISRNNIGIGVITEIDNPYNLDTKLKVNIDKSQVIPGTYNLVRMYGSAEGEFDFSSFEFDGQFETGVKLGVELGKLGLDIGKIGFNANNSSFGFTVQAFNYQGSLKCIENRHEPLLKDNWYLGKQEPADNWDKAQERSRTA